MTARFSITHTRRWTINKEDNGAAVFIDRETGKSFVMLGIDSDIWAYVLEALNEKHTGRNRLGSADEGPVGS